MVFFKNTQSDIWDIYIYHINTKNKIEAVLSRREKISILTFMFSPYVVKDFTSKTSKNKGFGLGGKLDNCLLHSNVTSTVEAVTI